MGMSENAMSLNEGTTLISLSKYKPIGLDNDNKRIVARKENERAYTGISRIR